MPESAVPFGVAIPCCNEAQNIGELLGRVAALRWRGAPPERIVVVSDASTDGTDAIVQAFAARADLPVLLEAVPQRRGKAAAVNRLLEALRGLDLMLLISGDSLPEGDCLIRLLDAFDDPRVGVAGGRPVPEGPAGNAVVEVTRLLWALHHRIAAWYPKTTEITAMRHVLAAIPEDSRADEAEIEAAITGLGYRVAYRPEALIRTNAPLTMGDYLEHRIRVTQGHLEVARRQGYRVGTLSLKLRFRALRDVWSQEPFSAFTVAQAIGLEAFIYLAATLKHRFGRPNGVWRRTDSTKRPFL